MSSTPIGLESPYFIDRASHCREQPEWLQAQLQNGGGKLLVASGSKLLCDANDLSQPRFVSLAEAEQQLGASVTPVFWGIEGCLVLRVQSIA